jgi:hypothetical protein
MDAVPLRPLACVAGGDTGQAQPKRP